MSTQTLHVRRMHPASPQTNPVEGTVRWAPAKSIWFTSHLLIAAIAGGLTFRWDALIACAVLTVITLCLGHTLGLHRLLIHRSFDCPRWLEHTLVYLGTLVGMGGPHQMLYLHDIRDWAQRHRDCHAFYIHHNPLWKDGLWQLHARLDLAHPPRFIIEARAANDRFYDWLSRYWMLQQLPLALILFTLGGWAWVVWGISVRIVVSLTGHWLVGYFAHNAGRRDWYLMGHAVQGYNLPYLGLLTMGECWHNNHHAFPESARLGLQPHQHDPGWWALILLKRLHLATRVREPIDLPTRPELLIIKPQTQT